MKWENCKSSFSVVQLSNELTHQNTQTVAADKRHYLLSCEGPSVRAQGPTLRQPTACGKGRSRPGLISTSCFQLVFHQNHPYSTHPALLPSQRRLCGETMTAVSSCAPPSLQLNDRTRACTAPPSRTCGAGPLYLKGEGPETTSCFLQSV